MVGLSATIGLISLSWHPSHDAPVVLYPAYLAWNGIKTPYSGIYDFNFPGTYLVYGFIGWITNLSDWGLQFVDLLLLIVGGFLAAFLFPKESRRQALIGYCSFACLYLGWFSEYGLQREFFCTLLALGACAAAIRSKRLWMVGLLCGAAILIKPTSAVAFAWIFVWALSRSPDWRQRGSASLLAAIGVSIPLLLTVIWLLRIGSLSDFLAITRNYSPLYLSMDGGHTVLTRPQHLAYDLHHLVAPDYGVLLLGGAIMLVLSLSWQDICRRRELRRVVLLFAGATVCFYIYPVFSGQIWRYHYLPFFAFGLITLAMGLCVTMGERREKHRQFVGTGLASLLLIYYARGAVVALQPGPSLPSDIVARQVSAYLTPRLTPGDTVQPLDWTGGTVAGMLQCRARLATSFLYDFEFYHNVSNPVIRGLRSRFIRELNVAKPRYVLQVNGEDKPWPSGPDTSREFPELNRFLKDNYVIATQYPTLVIWERSDPSLRAFRP